MAEASTARYRNKCTLSYLDGIPVCLKEEFKVVSFLSSCQFMLQVVTWIMLCDEVFRPTNSSAEA